MMKEWYSNGSIQTSDNVPIAAVLLVVSVTAIGLGLFTWVSVELGVHF